MRVGRRPLPCPSRQVNTSSVVLRKLLVGQQGEKGASSDVAERCVLPQLPLLSFPPDAGLLWRCLPAWEEVAQQQYV